MKNVVQNGNKVTAPMGVAAELIKYVVHGCEENLLNWYTDPDRPGLPLTKLYCVCEIQRIEFLCVFHHGADDSRLITFECATAGGASKLKQLLEFGNSPNVLTKLNEWADESLENTISTRVTRSIERSGKFLVVSNDFTLTRKTVVES